MPAMIGVPKPEEGDAPFEGEVAPPLGDEEAELWTTPTEPMEMTTAL